jgi:hypothetical protein
MDMRHFTRYWYKKYFTQTDSLIQSWYGHETLYTLLV